MNSYLLQIIFAEAAEHSGGSILAIIVIALASILTLYSLAGPERKHFDFMTRFNAYYPGAEVVETFHCSVVIKRDGKFFRITMNEDGRLHEELYRPFTESVLS